MEERVVESNTVTIIIERANTEAVASQEPMLEKKIESIPTVHSAEQYSAPTTNDIATIVISNRPGTSVKDTVTDNYSTIQPTSGLVTDDQSTMQTVTGSRTDVQSNVISGRPITHSTIDGETTEEQNSGSITSRTSSQLNEAATTDPVTDVQFKEKLSTQLVASRQETVVSERPGSNFVTDTGPIKATVTDAVSGSPSTRLPFTSSVIDDHSTFILEGTVTVPKTDGATTIVTPATDSIIREQSTKVSVADRLTSVPLTNQLSTELLTDSQIIMVSEGPKTDSVTDSGSTQVLITDPVTGSQSASLTLTGSITDDYSTVISEEPMAAPMTDNTTTVATPVTDSIRSGQSTKVFVTGLLTAVPSTEQSSTELVTDGQTRMASEGPKTVTFTNIGSTQVPITGQVPGSQSARPAFADSVTDDHSTVISEKPVTFPMIDSETTVKAQVADSITSRQSTYVSTTDLSFSVQSTKQLPTEQVTGGQTAVLSEGRGTNSLTHRDLTKIPVTVAVTGSQSSKRPITYSLTDDQMTVILAATITNTVTYDRTTDDAATPPTTTILSETPGASLPTVAESTESPETDPKINERSTITVRQGINDLPVTTSTLTSSLSYLSSKISVKPVETTKSTTERVKKQGVTLAKGSYYFL